MNRNMFANGRYGPTSEPMLGRLPTTGSTTNGHNSSTATAPAECRNSAATATPRTADSAANKAIAPTGRHVSGRPSDNCDAANGGDISLATRMTPTTIAAAYTAEKTDVTVAFASKTAVRLGVAMNVVRIIPLRYSPVTVIAARIISTGTPKTAAPVAAFSGGSGAAPYAFAPCSAARPRLSTATASADHSTDRVVDNLMRSESSTPTALIGSPPGIRRPDR